MIVLVYTHYFYFSVFLVIFRCLSFKLCYKLVLLGLERSLGGIFVWIVVKTTTNLVWASKAILSSTFSITRSRPPHLCVGDRNSQADRGGEDVIVEDMKGSGVSSWRLYPKEAIDVLADTYQLGVCTWLSLLVLSEKQEESERNYHLLTKSWWFGISH